MPGWVIGSIVGAWVLLFIIEEAGQYFWKRYVEDEPVGTRRSRIHLTRRRWASGILEKVSAVKAGAFGRINKHVAWQNAARFAGKISGRCAGAIRRVRSHASWEKLSLSVGQFFRKAAGAIGNVRSHASWEKLSLFAGQFFRKAAGAIGNVRSHASWEKLSLFVGQFFRKGAGPIGRVRSHASWEKLSLSVGNFFRKVAVKIHRNNVWQRASFYVNGSDGKLDKIKSQFAGATSRCSAFVKRAAAVVVSSVRSLALLNVKVVKLCLAGASAFVRKYRKSSSHS
ncbi:hypothetical protein V1499_10605 [Neobacillus sp. SCS-31]|uniref:hypothetical protein n=1 Tax=Neobacillus oceani TaxID=3115292 RepID=UPI00390693FD